MPTPKTGDEFTRLKAEWQDNLVFDLRLSAFARCVGLAIATYINRGKGEAWMSQETIAARLGATKRGVQKAIDELTNTDQLIVVSGRGRGVTNRYRLAFKKTNGGSPLPHENDEPTFATSEANDEPGFTFVEEKRRTAVPEKVNGHSKKGEPPFVQNLLIEPSDEPLTISRKVALYGEFDAWWNHYPKKVDKVDAFKAFAKARKKASLDQLIEGARRYAEERRDADPQYTRGPARWLNAGSWENEPVIGTNDTRIRRERDPGMVALAKIAKGQQ